MQQNYRVDMTRNKVRAVHCSAFIRKLKLESKRMILKTSKTLLDRIFISMVCI